MISGIRAKIISACPQILKELGVECERLVGHFWLAELVLRGDPNVGLRVPVLILIRPLDTQEYWMGLQSTDLRISEFPCLLSPTLMLLRDKGKSEKCLLLLTHNTSRPLICLMTLQFIPEFTMVLENLVHSPKYQLSSRTTLQWEILWLRAGWNFSV